jgi:hypothetical protein
MVKYENKNNWTTLHFVMYFAMPRIYSTIIVFTQQKQLIPTVHVERARKNSVGNCPHQVIIYGHLPRIHNTYMSTYNNSKLN